MQKLTPSFEQQLHIETQQYLAKGTRWLSVLSITLAVVLFVTKLFNNLEQSLVLSSAAIFPLIAVSLFGAIYNFNSRSDSNIPNYNRFYQYVIVLIIAWLSVCNVLLIQAYSASSRVEVLLHLIMFALMVSFFPLRRLLLGPVLVIAAYLAAMRILYTSGEVVVPLIKMVCFVGVVYSGQQVMEKWFRRAVFKDVENQRLVAELNQLALTDGLTKLSNRRHFDLMLNKEIQHSERTGVPMSIILIDIDYFKKLNDYLGHQRGDECLIELAKLLKNQIKRPRDVCARYGGEEFIVLLPETDISGALGVAQNIKMQLNQLAFKHPDSLASEFVTVSQGVAQWHSGMTLEQLVKQADDKLYEVKGQLRNNIAH